MKKILSIAASLLSAALCAQMAFFTTPNYKFSTSGFVPSGTPLTPGGTQGTYAVANGCYDNNSNLLFYVTRNGIYNPSGAQVGNLGYPGFTTVGAFPGTKVYYQDLSSSEFEIVPVPGTCKVYYVIYAMHVPPSLNKGCYIKVDCSSGSPVIIYNGIINTPGLPPAGAAWEFVSNSAGPNIAYAVSNIISGSNSSSIRYLYVATASSGIKYFTINNTGISGGVAMPNTNGGNYNTSELELSPDGNWLAWVSEPSTTNSALICQLNPTRTGFVTGQQWGATTSGATFKGLEFSKPISGVTYLYLAGSNGLSYVNTSTQSQPVTFSSGAYDLTNTFLEIGQNNKIYGVSKTVSTQHLIGIDPYNSNSLSFSAVSFDSRYTLNSGYYLQNIYTLPSQIDGQNYSDFYGNQTVGVAGITINNVAGVCGYPPDYYNCNPILLNSTVVGGTPAQYKIDVSYADGDCDNYYGPGALNYFGSWINGSVPANIDVRTLTDGNGLNLNNVLPLGTDNYKVTLWIKDACGNVTWAVSVFHLLSAVSAVVNLEIYNTYYTSPANTYLAAATTIGAAIPTGALSAMFRINNSTAGNVSSYNVNIDRVNNSGVVLSNIYNQTTNTNNINMVGPQSLNSLCVNASVWSPTVPGGGGCSALNPAYSGYTGYFGYSNGSLTVGNYYKLTVSISNICSSTSAFSYLYVNNGYARPSETTGLNDLENGDLISTIYPNPTDDKVRFTINSQTADVYSISLFNLLGQKVATIVDGGMLNVGETTAEFNTNELAAGVYSYKVTSGNSMKTGLLTITK